jgi:hypothetical protein
MAPIPTSTSVSESAVIEAPFSAVWHLIKLPSFSSWWSALEKSDEVKGASAETDIIKWTFKDGTALEVKQEEHSVSLPSKRTIYVKPFGLSMVTVVGFQDALKGRGSSSSVLRKAYLKGP